MSMDYAQLEALMLDNDADEACSPPIPVPLFHLIAAGEAFPNEDGIKLKIAQIAVLQLTDRLGGLIKELYNMVQTYRFIYRNYHFDITLLPSPAQSKWIKLERLPTLTAYLERIYTGQFQDPQDLVNTLSGISVDDAYLVCRLIEYANSYMFDHAFTTIILKAVRALFTIHFHHRYPRLVVRMPKHVLTSMSYLIWRQLQNGAPNLDMFTMNYIGGFVIWLTENRSVRV